MATTKKVAKSPKKTTHISVSTIRTDAPINEHGDEIKHILSDLLKRVKGGSAGQQFIIQTLEKITRTQM